jgi:hypothetical protein
MNINIKTYNKIYNIDIDYNKTILNLKYLIKKLLNIDENKQRLSFRGIPLIDQKNIEYYNIQENNTIFLVITI